MYAPRRAILSTIQYPPLCFATPMQWKWTSSSVLVGSPKVIAGPFPKLYTTTSNNQPGSPTPSAFRMSVQARGQRKEDSKINSDLKQSTLTENVPSNETTGNSMISTGHLKENDLKLFSTLSDERALRFRNVLLRRTRRVTVVLDGVQGPHNVGAVARTCDAWGIQDLHFISKSSPSSSPSLDDDTSILSSFQIDKTVQKVSKNSHRWLSMNEYSSPNDAVTELRRRGYKICVSSLPLRNSHAHVHDIFNEDDNEQLFNGKVAFVFGAEQDGVSQYCIDEADAYFTIPMVGFTESFNVSVAVSTLAAVALPRLRNRRNTQLDGAQSSDCYLAIDEAAELASSWLRGLPNHSANDAGSNENDWTPSTSSASGYRAGIENNEEHDSNGNEHTPSNPTAGPLNQFSPESATLTSKRQRRRAKSDSGPDVKSLENRYAKGDVTRLGTGIETRIFERGLFLDSADVDEENSDKNGQEGDRKDSMNGAFKEFGIRLHPKTGLILVRYFNKRKFGVMGDYKWKHRTDNMTYFISGCHALTCALVTKQIYHRRVHLLPLFKSICQDLHESFSSLFDQFGIPLHPSSPATPNGSNSADLMYAQVIGGTGEITRSRLGTFGISTDEIMSMTFEDVCRAFAICVENGRTDETSEEIDQFGKWCAECMYELHEDAVQNAMDKQVVEKILACSSSSWSQTQGADDKRRANVNVTIRAAHAAWICGQIHMGIWDQHRSLNSNRLRTMRCNLLENIAVDAYAYVVMNCTDHGYVEDPGRKRRLGIASAVLEWYRPLWMLQVNAYGFDL